jgi:F-type H+-transporting ATPase subunit delta
MNISIKQYTTAFYQIAEGKKKLEEATVMLSSLSQNSLMLENFLANPGLTIKQKKELLEKSGVIPEVANFLLILEKNNDLKYLDSIISALKGLLNEKSNLAEIEIEVTENLNEEEINNIKTKLEKKLQKKVILKTKVNKEILGGIIIKIGDNLIDNSLKGKLIKLKDELNK